MREKFTFCAVPIIYFDFRQSGSKLHTQECRQFVISCVHSDKRFPGRWQRSGKVAVNVWIPQLLEVTGCKAQTCEQGVEKNCKTQMSQPVLRGCRKCGHRRRHRHESVVEVEMQWTVSLVYIIGCEAPARSVRIGNKYHKGHIDGVYAMKKGRQPGVRDERQGAVFGHVVCHRNHTDLQIPVYNCTNLECTYFVPENIDVREVAGY